HTSMTFARRLASWISPTSGSRSRISSLVVTSSLLIASACAVNFACGSLRLDAQRHRHLPEAPDVVGLLGDLALHLWREGVEGLDGDRQALALAFVSPHAGGLAIDQHDGHGLPTVIDLALAFRADEAPALRIAQDVRIEGREKLHRRARVRRRAHLCE